MTGTPYAEVIGDPIGHSRSPAIHGFWLSRLGLSADYRACRVTPEGLADYFAARRIDPDWRGCNITIPHKHNALPLVDSAEDGGIGAVNTVVRSKQGLVGRNTDMGGLAASLPEQLPEGERIVLVGGGGAAAAALAAFKARKLACDLIVRNREQGEKLIERIGAQGRVLSFEEAPQAIAGSAGLVNASPLGMNGFPPMPPQILSSVQAMSTGGFVLDMVYVPLRTPLLEQAVNYRLVAIDGLAMLIGQAALAFRYFFAVDPPRDADAELRALLTT